MPPRYYGDAHNESGLAAAVGGVLSGYDAVEGFRRNRRVEAEQDADRRRRIDAENRQRAIEEMDAGIQVGGAGPGAAPGTTTVAVPPPSVPADEMTAALEAQTPRPAMAAPARASAAGNPGLLQRVGSFLRNRGHQFRTGGFQDYQGQPPVVTKVGPSSKERADEAQRTHQTGMNDADNKTSLRVAGIGAQQRADAATLHYGPGGPEAHRRTLTALQSQIKAHDKAVSEFDNLIRRAQPASTASSAERLKVNHQRGQLELERKRIIEQRARLMVQLETFTLSSAQQVPGFAPYMPPPAQAEAAFPSGPVSTGPAPVSAGSRASYTSEQIEQMYQRALARGADPGTAAERRDALLQQAAR